MMDLLEKLTYLQNELKAPKNQKNDFGKYMYRSAEDILEAVKPLLKKYDLTQYINDEIVLIGERYYIKATITLEDKDKKVSVSAYAREALTKKGMDDSQVTGTASSYARKYALNGLYAIDDTKDSDTNEHRKEVNSKAKKVEGKRNSKIDNLMLFVRKADLKNEEVSKIIKTTYKKENSQDLTDDELDDLIEKIKGLGNL